MNAAPDIFVTGASRSGTSLLDKLLLLHPEIEVLSQPLPRLYVEIKRRFLQPRPTQFEQSFPLNDLFDGEFRPPEQFTAFLHTAQYDPGWLAGVLRGMSGFSGQITRTDLPVDTLVPDAPLGLAAFVAKYQAALSTRPNVSLRGSKEPYAEEFIPYFLQSGTRIILMVRDPRDVVTSVFGPRGVDYAGAGLPLLFVLRQWRKSVGFALAHANDPGFRLLRYEDLVSDPAAQMDSIAAWLGCASFPDDLADQMLVDRTGLPWLSNSSYRPEQGVSKGGVGRGKAVLSEALIRAVETLCAPEMRVLSYEIETTSDATDPLDGVTDPCTDPRPSLASYVWGDAALRPERQRLAGIEAGQFTPRLHLFEGAFRQLAHPPGATPRPPVVGGRASALIHDLAYGARPGAFLLPANICPEVPLALALAGRGVQFVDVDPDSLCMQTDAALQILRSDPGISGVIYARTYGAMFDVSEFFAQVRDISPEVLILDDRCPCRPQIEFEDPESIGAHAILFSTGRAKYADLGGGYAFLASGVPYQATERPFDPAHAAAVEKWFKSPPADPPADTLGQLNARWPHWLDSRATYASWPAMRMAVAAECDRIDAHKAQMNAIYERILPRDACLGDGFNGWRFHLRVPDKPAVLAEIFAAGAFASGHCRPAAGLFSGPVAPVAEALDRQVLGLFNDRNIDAVQAAEVAAIVRNHLQGSTPAKTGANSA